MSTYAPREGVFVGRPPCANCGANLQLHTIPAGVVEGVTVPITVGPTERRYLTSRGLQKLLDEGVGLECPEAYRPSTLEAARRALADAEAAGDSARIFTARGDLQRLEGRK
jgi:hypothetical protein